MEVLLEFGGKQTRKKKLVIALGAEHYLRCMTITQTIYCSTVNCVRRGFIQRNKMRKWQRELAVKDAQTKMGEQCPFRFNGRLCGLPKGHLGGCIPYQYLRESDKLRTK